MPDMPRYCLSKHFYSEQACGGLTKGWQAWRRPALKTGDLPGRKNIPAKASCHILGHTHASDCHVDIIRLSTHCVTAQRNVGIVPGSPGKQRKEADAELDLGHLSYMSNLAPGRLRSLCWCCQVGQKLWVSDAWQVQKFLG